MSFFFNKKGRRRFLLAVPPVPTLYLSTSHKPASNVVNHATTQFLKLAENKQKKNTVTVNGISGKISRLTLS
jgi:hypothetical protein